jgi:hypothetical protein
VDLPGLLEHLAGWVDDLDSVVLPVRSHAHTNSASAIAQLTAAGLCDAVIMIPIVAPDSCLDRKTASSAVLKTTLGSFEALVISDPLICWPELGLTSS